MRRCSFLHAFSASWRATRWPAREGGVLAGTWAATSAGTALSAPGSTSPVIGVILLLAGLCLLVPTAAGTTKLTAVAVMGLSSLRFILTGVAHLTGGGG